MFACTYESAFHQCARKRHMTKRGAKLTALRLGSGDRGRRYHAYRCPWCNDGWLVGSREGM